MLWDKDPQHWKLWLFYYNPDEPRLLVAKWYGSPWTLNFARPLAWAFVAVPVAVMTLGAIVDRLHSGR